MGLRETSNFSTVTFINANDLKFRTRFCKMMKKTQFIFSMVILVGGFLMADLKCFFGFH